MPASSCPRVYRPWTARRQEILHEVAGCFSTATHTQPSSRSSIDDSKIHLTRRSFFFHGVHPMRTRCMGAWCGVHFLLLPRHHRHSEPASPRHLRPRIIAKPRRSRGAHKHSLGHPFTSPRKTGYCSTAAPVLRRPADPTTSTVAAERVSSLDLHQTQRTAESTVRRRVVPHESHSAISAGISALWGPPTVAPTKPC